MIAKNEGKIVNIGSTAAIRMTCLEVPTTRCRSTALQG